MKCFKIIAVILLSIGLVACVAALRSKNYNGYMDSASVTAEITDKLHRELGFKGQGIRVHAYGEEVQLTGYVENDFIRKKAAEIAARTSDVKLVRNNITVVSHY